MKKLKYRLGRYARKDRDGELPAQHINCYCEGYIEHLSKIVVYGTKCKAIAAEIVKTLNEP